MKSSLVLGIVLISFGTTVSGEEASWSAVDVHKRQYESTALKQDLRLTVGLPSTYSSSQETYPVVYYLDPIARSGMFREIAYVLGRAGEHPEVITVGIGTNPDSAQDWMQKRTYLFTASKSDAYIAEGVQASWGGGAVDFLTAIQTEIIPWVDTKFRTRKGDRTIFGHSLGGHFVLYALLGNERLFNNYIVSDPSVGWDNSLLVRREAEYAEKNQSLPIRLFMSVSSASTEVDLTTKLFEKIKERNYQDLVVGGGVLDKETHYTVVPTAFTRGMKFVFSSP